MKMKTLQLPVLVFGIFAFLVTGVHAQKSLQSIQKLQDENKISSYQINEERNTPFLIKFDESTTQKATQAEAPQMLRQALALDNKITLTDKNKTSLANGLQVEKFQENYKGIKVEHGNYSVLSKNGTIMAIGLEHYDFPKEFSVTPSLSEDAALQQAINFVNAEEYAWDMYSTMKMNETSPKKLAAYDAIIESVYPQGELVIVDDYNTAGVDLKLAYKFNVYAAKPLYRADIYIDAKDGKMLLADMDIKHAAEINESIKRSEKMSNFSMLVEVQTGNGDLRYAGNRQFQTTFVPGATPATDEYQLLGTIFVDAVDPADGQFKTGLPIENETQSYDGVGGVPLAVNGIPSYPITDGSSRLAEGQTTVEIADNNWTAEEHYRDRFAGPGEVYPVSNETNNDDVALDAHWGSEIVLRYWGVRHNRWGWDGNGRRITSFVHYGDAYDNAFYTNATMTYGDGSYQGGSNPNGSFAPLSSIDVAGHEIGHGVCDTTSDLVYARQSGGMNEGFSDLWAAAVENYVIQDIDPTLAARYQPFSIGEQIDERDGGIQPEDNNPAGRALRFMDDPKAAGDPDCILGVNWLDTSESGCPAPSPANDQCGVHSNSGVLNKWFYLLSTGSGKALTPGRNKVPVDDEVNDNNMPYSVEGIGFVKAELIAFGGEVLLSPNATFAEMREMSILTAQNLYGQGSPEEEATTSAWFAVCVGNDYVRPAGNIVRFNSSNPVSLQERNSSTGCLTSRTYDYSISSTLVDVPTTINLDVSKSTATLDEDFSITPTSIVVSGSGVYNFTIEVFDDAIIENGEMINISFDFTSTTDGVETTVTNTQEIALVDDDITPKVGASIEELIVMPSFGDNIPEGWSIVTPQDLVVNNWAFNGTGAPGLAYITDGTTETPMYNGNGPGVSLDGSTNTILMTSKIDGLGLRDVNVSFDYTVGGEEDGGPSPLDYGELVYSFDGTNFFGVERFAGPGGTIITGTFDGVIPQVENSQFFIGFRWFNDQLLGTAYSFSIDNIRITGSPALVETQAGTSQNHTVRAGNDIYFQTIENNNIVARIQNASADLGCVNLSVVESGNEPVVNNNAGFTRSGKVIQIVADGPNAATATYDVTFYMTADELAGFQDINTLKVLKVDGNDIDAANTSNSQVSGELLNNFTDTEGYATFEGSFTGFSSFAIIEGSVAGVDDLSAANDIALYPSPVSRGNNVTIASPSISIDNTAIYDVRGARVRSQQFDGLNSVQLNTNTLQSGVYFVRLNNDKAKTFKFIVN